ncbi:MAG: hypothetical protein KatS3mg110_2713 [Pirellulaceae bacterium]|nr:MAG: hypothetical protein KatS3mg110_2713 [Pirellulaceae bacterium]
MRFFVVKKPCGAWRLPRDQESPFTASRFPQRQSNLTAADLRDTLAVSRQEVQGR